MTEKVQKKINIPKTDMSARGIAVEILNRIELNGAYAEPLLDACLSGDRTLAPHTDSGTTSDGNNPRNRHPHSFQRGAGMTIAGDSPVNRLDRGLITELVYGVLRNRNRLDWAITHIYSGVFDSMEIPVRNILRTGVYQLLNTDRIPPFAAVNETVDIAKNIRPAAAGLVNAVLRNTLRKKEEIIWPDPDEDVVRAISVNYSHPAWMVERWRELYGREETIAICRANNEIPPLTVRVNTLKTSREKMVETFKDEGVSAKPTLFSPEGIAVLDNSAGLRQTDAFRQGMVRVQDEASQLVAHLLNPQPGEHTLDFCAGAGGKTLHLAALMQNRGEITAIDINRAKLGMLVAETGRLGITIVQITQGDGNRKNAVAGKMFDRVLIDAPCSGLGTLRRNPEIRWRLAGSDIPELQQKQKNLLQNGASHVRPGGRLVYCVCTTTPEETDEVVADFLKSNSSFKLIRPDNIPGEIVTDDGFLRTFPHHHSLDGFFGALFVRRG
jgi:16S rRNA (cytosine967-C5)-methyltransferase